MSRGGKEHRRRKTKKGGRKKKEKESVLIPAPTLPRICKQQFIERGVCRDGDRIRRSSGIAAHLFDRRRRWLEGRMGLVGPPLPFLHAASPTSIQRSIQREGRGGGRRGGKGKGGEGRESGACAPPPPSPHFGRPTEQTSWTPAHGSVVCRLPPNWRSTEWPGEAGHLELSRRHLRRDRAQPRRWVPGNNDAQLNSASRHALRAPANAGPSTGVNLGRVHHVLLFSAETCRTLNNETHRQVLLLKW